MSARPCTRACQRASVRTCLSVPVHACARACVRVCARACARLSAFVRRICAFLRACRCLWALLSPTLSLWGRWPYVCWSLRGGPPERGGGGWGGEGPFVRACFARPSVRAPMPASVLACVRACMQARVCLRAIARVRVACMSVRAICPPVRAPVSVSVLAFVRACLCPCMPARVHACASVLVLARVRRAAYMCVLASVSVTVGLSLTHSLPLGPRALPGCA